MRPNFPRVAAIDDNNEHLAHIINGLGLAGYWAMPFLYDAGKLIPTPPLPASGIRLIFSDIHIGTGNMDIKQNVDAILSCLKKIIDDGPYGIIFWSSYPDEAKQAWETMLERCDGHGVKAPVCHGLIDKNKVLAAPLEDFNPAPLAKDIADVIQGCPTLALTMAWDERVALAAIKTTNRLYAMASDPKYGAGASTEDPTELAHLPKWNALLSFLAAQAVGKEQALRSPLYALDNALIPIVEDQLYAVSLAEATNAALPDAFRGSSLATHLETKGAKDRMGIASAAELNSLYLIENQLPDSLDSAARGMVSQISETDDEKTVSIFGQSQKETIKREFFRHPSNPLNAESESFLSDMKLCLVTLIAECDEVNNKVRTFRYLLATLIKTPDNEAQSKLYFDQKNNKFANDSIYSLGNIRLNGEDNDSLLLVSCSRFIATHSRTPIKCVPIFRLRRSTLEELLHRYTVHARRPGVMRFFD